MVSAGSDEIFRNRFKQAFIPGFILAVFFAAAGAAVGAAVAAGGGLTRLNILFTAYYYGTGYGLAGFAAGILPGLAGKKIPGVDKIPVRWTFVPAVTAGAAAFYSGLLRIYSLYSLSGLIDKTDVTEMIILLAGASAVVVVICVSGLELILFLIRSKRLFPAIAVAAAAPLVFLAPVVKSNIDSRFGRFNPENLAGSYNGGRILLLGLDGADWNLLDPLIDGGELPGFAKLVSSSVTAPLISQYMFSPQSWTSIGTGCYRDKHGVYDFNIREYPDGDRLAVQEVPLGEYVIRAYDRIFQASREAAGGPDRVFGAGALDMVPRFFNEWVIHPAFRAAFSIENRSGGRLSVTSFRDVDTPFLWECFQAAGASCGVINWLNSTPADPSNGWIVSGAAGVGRVPGFSEPGTMCGEIDEYWRKHRTVWLDRGLTPCTDSLLAWRIEDVRTIPEASRMLDETAVRSYGEAEAARVVIPHLLRKYPDLKLLAWPLYFTDALGHRFCHLLERPYEAGRYSGIYLESLKRVDILIDELMDIESLTICIVSDHGMSEVPAVENLPLDWQGFKFDFSRLIETLSTSAPPGTPGIVPRVTDDGVHVFDSVSSDEKTVSWWLQTLKSVTIRFNSDETVLFRHLRRGRKGEPAILVEEFTGFKFSELGDIDGWEIRCPNRVIAASDIITDLGIRCLHGRPSPDSRLKLGRKGVFLLYGPGVGKGVRIEPVKTVDVAPTLLSLAGLPVADGMDGRPQPACFTPGFHQDRKTRITTYPRVGLLDYGTDSRETGQVGEALRALGYIQ